MVLKIVDFLKIRDNIIAPKKIKGNLMLKRMTLVFVFAGVSTAVWAGALPITTPTKPPDGDQLDCLVRCLDEGVTADKCKRICK